MTRLYHLHSDPTFAEDLHHKEMEVISEKDLLNQKYSNHQYKTCDPCNNKRLKRDVSIDPSLEYSREIKRVPLEPLTPHRIQVRMKQVDYGKNTRGYDRYTEIVPKHQRQISDPKTPDIYQSCSRRSWDGQIKKWRRMLHKYDDCINNEHYSYNFDDSSSIEKIDHPQSCPERSGSSEYVKVLDYDRSIMTMEKNLMASILSEELRDKGCSISRKPWYEDEEDEETFWSNGK